MKPASLYIGESYLVATRFVHGEISEEAKVKLPKDTFANGSLVSPEQLLASLEKLQEDIPLKHVSVFLPPNRVYRVGAAIHAKHRAKGVLKNTLDNLVPEPTEDLRLGKAKLFRTKEDTVFGIGAVQEELLSGIVSGCKQVGITVTSLHTESSRLALITGKKLRKKLYFLVQKGIEKTTVSLCFGPYILDEKVLTKDAASSLTDAIATMQAEQKFTDDAITTVYVATDSKGVTAFEKALGKVKNAAGEPQEFELIELPWEEQYAMSLKHVQEVAPALLKKPSKLGGVFKVVATLIILALAGIAVTVAVLKTQGYSIEVNTDALPEVLQDFLP